MNRASQNRKIRLLKSEKEGGFFNQRSEIEREISRLEVKIEFLHSVVASEKVDLRAGELMVLLGEIKEIIGNLLREQELEKFMAI